MNQTEQINSYELNERIEIVFEDLFKNYFVKLVRYAAEIVKDLDTAEEIAENTFVKLWENRESIDITTSLQQYLYKSVYHSCLNHLKHKEVENKYKLFFYHHIIPNEIGRNQDELPLTNMMAEELQKIIQKTINDLPSQCKTVFELSRYEDLTNDEIAKNLDVSINTVKTHIGRALSKLRIALKDYLVLFLV